MSSSFFFLIFLTLSASSQRILTEAQHSKSFLRVPQSPAIDSLTSQQDGEAAPNHPEISSGTLEETVQSTGDDQESSLIAQRMLPDEPILTSIQLTTIPPPPSGPGNESKPTVVTTETYVLEVQNEEEIIITVEDNQDALEVLEAAGVEQPQLVNGEDVFISSWWTIEYEETVFENWEQLESFLGAQYGSEPQIGIDVNAEDVPVEIEIVVPEVPAPPPPPSAPTQNINEDLSAGVINLTDIVQGTAAVDWGQYEQEEITGVETVYANLITTTKPKCKQVQTCQRLFVRPIGFRNVCKNQLVCPKT